MKTKTHVKAGGTTHQHNQTQVRSGLTVKTGIKAGPIVRPGDGDPTATY